ncbi:acyltransferase family protein [Reichenbachiella sp.]|uniref:acyltransferase family protein n=1 Tax=Reichenbachiella sp. TaxID=2184521 RepID=UPI003B5964E7
MIFARLKHILNQSDRISAFDFVRAMAAMSVLITHFEIVDTLSIDIDAFFILSGYLITQFLYEDESLDINKKYLVKRITKILPSYFFFVIVAFLLGSLFFKNIYGENLPILSEWKQYFFFYRNYGGLPPRWSFEHLWTICVEEHFYFLMLFISVLWFNRMDFRARIPWILFGILLLSLMAKIQAMFTLIAEYPTYTHNRLDAFCIGGIMYLFQDRYISIPKVKKLIAAILAIIILGTVIIFDQSINGLLLRCLSPIMLSIVFIYLLEIEFQKIFTVLAYYSYNLYLWHNFLVIPVVYYWGFSWMGFLIYTTLSFALAVFTTHMVEDYFISKRSMIFTILFKEQKSKNT